jgi:hypothetical protein
MFYWAILRKHLCTFMLRTFSTMSAAANAVKSFVMKQCVSFFPSHPFLSRDRRPNPVYPPPLSPGT